MQIDFHQASKAESKPLRQRTHVGRAPVWRKILGGSTVCLGIILVLYSLLMLTTTRRATPYALLIFSSLEKDGIAATPTLLWVNEQKSTVALTSFPDNLEFHSQSLGTYPLSSLYTASVKTNQSHADFLTDLSLYFRFPISNFIVSPDRLVLTRRSILLTIASNCLRNQTGSLTLGECLHQLAFWISPTITLRELDFPKTALSEGSLKSLRALDRKKYREWAQSHFSETYAFWKNYTIAVLNGTDVSGLATIASSVLDDFGFTILYVGETASPVKSGTIYFRRELHESALITAWLGASMRLPTQENETMTTQYRSDVVVVIGENEKKFFAP